MREIFTYGSVRGAPGNRRPYRVQLEFHPDDIDERIGDRLDFVSSRTSADLERFKEFIEEVSTA